MRGAPTKEKIEALPVHPLLEGIPDGVKNVEAYVVIERELFNIVKSSHKHKKIGVWMRCKQCQKRHVMQTERIVSLGFKDRAQYSLWRRVMDIIYKKQSNEEKEN